MDRSSGGAAGQSGLFEKNAAFVQEAWRECDGTDPWDHWFHDQKKMVYVSGNKEKNKTVEGRILIKYQDIFLGFVLI